MVFTAIRTFSQSTCWRLCYSRVARTEACTLREYQEVEKCNNNESIKNKYLKHENNKIKPRIITEHVVRESITQYGKMASSLKCPAAN